MKKLIIGIMLLASISFTTLNLNAAGSYYQNAIGRTMNIVTGGPSSINFEHPILSDAYLSNMALLKDDTDLETYNTFTSSSFSGISQSISSTFGLNVDIDGTYKGIRGEISTGYNQAGIESASNLYSQFYYYKYIKIKKYSLFINNIGYQNQNLKNNLSIEYLSYLNALQSGIYSYTDFFNRFGTHLIISGEFGGKLEHKYSMFTNEIAFTSGVSSSLKTSIAASVPLTGTANISSTSGFEQITSINGKTFNDSDNIIKIGGGTYQGNYLTWLNSLSENTSRLIGFTSNSLIPLWELLPTQYIGIKNAMMNAFDSYYNQKMSEIYGYFTIDKYVNSTESISYQRGIEYQITDSGRENQLFDIIFSEMPIEVLKSLGYTNFTLSISGEYWEVDDGFQWVFIYATPRVKSTDYDLETKIAEKKFEHSTWSNSSTKKDLVFNITTTNLNVFPSETNGIIIRYGASGIGADTWKISNLVVTLTFSK